MTYYAISNHVYLMFTFPFDCIECLTYTILVSISALYEIWAIIKLPKDAFLTVYSVLNQCMTVCVLAHVILSSTL